ncbi:MAG TPA: Gldg family protein [Vicinamibacterales bacterium]|nr:Gldg family protein [Vicinamibacterales bacterium]
MKRLFDIIGWIGTALVIGAVALAVIPSPYGEYRQYLAMAGLVAVLIYMAGQWRDVAEFYKSRGARYGTLSLVSIIVFVAILVAINYLATRQNKRWDFTANQVYSLSDQTIKILRELKEPVTFVVFERVDRQDAHRDRLDEYRYYSSNVRTEFVDPDREPARATEAKIETLPTILVQFKGRTERVTSTNEQDLTNGLIKAITGQARKVYFTQGHGEKDTASSDRTGYSTISQALTQDNYGVEQLVLITQKQVPDDATVVVIAGPTTDFFPPEIEALKAYVAKGGKVMALLDPAAKIGVAQPLLAQFLTDWGINPGNDVVLDASGMGQMLGTDASVPVAAQYPSHAITTGFRVITAYPMARSMSPIEGGSNGHTAQPLVTTSAQSWAEADIASLSSGKGQVEFNGDKGDKQGPITLASAVSAPATDKPPAPAGNATPDGAEPPPPPETRIVAVGDSDFAANLAIGVQGNRDLFMNAINWLAQQENLIAVRPRQPEDHRLTLTADQQNSIMILSIFIIPGLVFAAGVYTWWRRR